MPPPTVETLREIISLSTRSSMEIAGLLKKKKRKNMMTRIRKIACERILAQSTGATYDAFRRVDSWILARE